jgi:hypothetical protein
MSAPVDVVVPCYRYGHFLSRCVRSVLDQQGVEVRVLIIDDASPDDSAEMGAALHAADPRVHLRLHAANQGHIATFNEGLGWASAPWQMLLSADDFLLPGALARAVALLERHPKVGFVFGNADELADGVQTRHQAAAAFGARLPGEALVLRGRDFIALGAGRNLVPTPTVVVRTALQKRLGGYRSELPHTGDLEMWLRLAAHGSVGVLGATQAVYRRHAGNMSLAYQRQHRLPDLMERGAAVRWFLEHDARSLPDHEWLGQAMLHALSQDALGLASEAFNEGAADTALERLLEFARLADPQADATPAARRLRLKRRLGRGAWQMLRPWVQAARRRGLLADPARRTLGSTP